MNERRLAWTLLTIAALNLAYGLAGSARLDEMKQAIEAQVEDGDERASFVEAVEGYIEARNDALTRLASFIADAGESEREGAWTSIIDDLGDIPELSDVDDELSSEAALALYDQFMTEEQAWVSALSVLETAAYRDDLIQLKLRLDNMTTLLEDKWKELLDDDGQLDQEERAAIAAISETYGRTAREMRDARERTRGYLNTLADVAANDMVGSFIPGVLGDIVGMLAQTVKAYNDYRSAVETMQTQLKELSAQELKLLEGFLTTRKDTQLFVEQNGLDVMKAHYADADGELRAFTGVGTSAQRRDAEEFADQVRGALSEHVSEGESTFNAFVTRHQGKFFGPVAPDIEEALLETQVWLAEGEDAESRGRDLQELLRAWRDDANTLFGVSFSRDGITDEERQFIQDYLRGDLEAVMEAMEEGQAFVQTLTASFDRRGLEDALK